MYFRLHLIATEMFSFYHFRLASYCDTEKSYTSWRLHLLSSQCFLRYSRVFICSFSRQCYTSDMLLCTERCQTGFHHVII